MARRSPSPANLLLLVIAVLCILALAPTRFTGWVGVFRDPLLTVITPGSAPLARLSSFLRPGQTVEVDIERASEAELRRQLGELRTLHHRALQKVAELEGVIRDLQGGLAYRADTPVRRIEAPRHGTALESGAVLVGRGETDGVRPGSVATVRGSQQLVGRVTRVGPRVSTVQLLTDPRLEPRRLRGLVVPDIETGSIAALSPEEQAELPRIDLVPQGDGTFVDPEVGADKAGRIGVGHLALLDDPSWESWAQMLTIGTVVRVEETDNPLFKRVVVRPRVDVSRVKSVILHIPLPPEDAP